MKVKEISISILAAMLSITVIIGSIIIATVFVVLSICGGIILLATNIVDKFSFMELMTKKENFNILKKDK